MRLLRLRLDEGRGNMRLLRLRLDEGRGNMRQLRHTHEPIPGRRILSIGAQLQGRLRLLGLRLLGLRLLGLRLLRLNTSIVTITVTAYQVVT